MKQQIPADYKQTEVGAIPEDWEVKALSYVAPLQRGFDLPTHQLRRGPFPVVYSNGVLHCHYKAMVTGPGVVTGRSGTIGRVNFIKSDYWPHNTTLWVTSFKGNAPKFIYYLYQNIGLERFGTGSGVPTLNRNDVHAFSVSMPPVSEQEAIAEALSDADALIESLEQLITKKRHIKQGAMQQLLTGKKRLPGFSGEWEVKALNEVCWYQEGPGVRNTQFTASGIKLLNGTNIFRGMLNLETTNRFISEKEAHGAYAHFLADAGDIVIASSGITIERFHEKVAFVREFDLPFCMNTSTIRFKPYYNVLAPTFLYQFLTSDSFKRMIGGQATGSAQLNFGPSHLAKIPLLQPPINEQTAITTILSDMDTEIAALETQLTKTRSLKQGMMHNLLTGKIRLL